jgi:ABC-type multidrug transport system permease subunit
MEDFVTASTGPTARTLAGPVGVVVDGWIVTGRNLRRMSRIPEFGILAIVQSVMFLLLFAFVFAGAIPIPGGDYRNFLMGGLFTLTVAFSVQATAVGLADDLHHGMIDRFRSLPMARSAVLSGRVSADLAQNALILVVMAVSGLLIGWRIHRGVGDAALAFITLLLFSFAMSWIGALIGLSVSTPETANSAGLIWVFPLTFVSNVFVPASALPGWLRQVADWNPVSVTARAARQLFGNPTGDIPGRSESNSLAIRYPEPVALAWVLVVLIVFVFLSVRRYQRM